MKIAYLIQAHKDPTAINRLINKLSGVGKEFYVHIDKKSPDTVINDIIKRDDVIILKDRLDVKWGHISQVEATIKLMNAVELSDRRYDYVWLISGQDFPIKTNEYIDRYLSDNYGANFIELIPEHSDVYKRFLKRNQTWYPIWAGSPKFIVRVLRKLYNIFTGGTNRSLVKRKNYLNVEWQFGSPWWTITYDAMLFILSEVERKNYIKYYRNSICPDESFFQTILYNSHYKDTIKPFLLYVDWSEGKKNPKNLNLTDYDKLKVSDKLIARKFDGEIDCKILELSQEK